MILDTSRQKKVLSGLYEFKFGQYFNDGFSLVTRNIGHVLGFMILWCVISVGVDILPLVGPFVYSLVVGPCLLAGFYLGMDKSFKREYLDFGVFFKGFDKVGQLVLMTLLQFVIAFATLIPMIIAVIAMGVANYNTIGNSDDLILFVPIIMILALPLLYLVVAWSFAPLFILFYNMEAWAAMEMSRKVITAKWFAFFGLAFVGGLVAVAGALALIVGLLITIPAYLAMTYAAFRDIVGMPEETEADNTISHLVE